jgi:hypothetical protein
MYDNFSEIFLDTANRHAPVKKKHVLQQPVPFMNKTLKQAIFKKRMLQNKYNFCKSSKNWENFRKQRNLVTKLRRKSINKYFIDRCTGGCKSSNFWPTVKPFLTIKGVINKKIQFYVKKIFLSLISNKSVLFSMIFL